jgi:hypothetical protein
MLTSAATYDGIERGKSQWLPHGLVKVRHCDGVVARDNRSWNAVVSEPPARAARERVKGDINARLRSYEVVVGGERKVGRETGTTIKYDHNRLNVHANSSASDVDAWH